MKKKVKIGFMIFYILFLFSCTNSNNQRLNLKEKIITWKDFGRLKTLKLDSVNHIEMVTCSGIYKNDSLLFFVDTYTKDYLITITDLKGNVINKSIRRGRGPNEMSYLFFIGFIKTKGLMYAYDGYLDNILYYFKIRDVISQKVPKIKKVFELGTGRRHIINILSENKFVAITDTSKYRLQIIDTNKKVLKNIGKYMIKDLNNENILYINTAFLRKVVINKAEDKLAIFYGNTDILDIFDTTGVLLYSSHGPDNFNIYNFKPNKVKDSPYHGKLKKSRIAYEGAVSHGKYIYTFYDGNIIKGPTTTAQKLLIFDWNGKPIKYYYLSKPISAFDIDTATNTLYGYNMDNGVLYKAKLNLPE